MLQLKMQDQLKKFHEKKRIPPSTQKIPRFEQSKTSSANKSKR